jgi:hypothetical protein
MPPLPPRQLAAPADGPPTPRVLRLSGPPVSARLPDPDTALWRVRVGPTDPVYFHTERGARTSVALRHADTARAGTGAEPVVEHRAHAGEPWHPCPSSAVGGGSAQRIAEETARAMDAASVRPPLPDRRRVTR